MWVQRYQESWEGPSENWTEPPLSVLSYHHGRYRRGHGLL